MKIVSIFISFFFFIINITFGQTRSPKTYALVIGVSKYEDPKITSLKHAHKDAEAFAEFCASSSGLNIAADQLKVLINEKASYWDIVSGLEWLKTNAQKDDHIYIYFAGHGDMESKALKYGYLLANDSRYMNYIGRSLSLDDLNKTAHTISVDRKAKVFLITDACHSGKLAGVDFDGSNLVALNLMQVVSSNEVRITSCNEGELSYEDEKWGNGRGAFSYFLTTGMSGEADGVGGTKDGNITIGEIKTFLNGKVPEEVRTVKSKKQNPVVKGTEATILNSFKASAGDQNLAIATRTSNEISTNTGSRSVSAETNNDWEEDIRNTTISKARDQNTDFKILSSKPVSEIVNVLLHTLIKEKKYSKKTLTSVPSQQIVAKTLYDLVQEIIDLYLSADESELEKREYYKQIDKPYDQYPYMLDIAIKLLPKDHLIIPSLQMQRAYMSGLNYRLQAPFKGKFNAQIDTAFFYQQKALSIDSSAAYIHNELGVLYSLNGRLDTAISYYEQAISIAPLWPLPYSNLANAYYIKKDFVKSKEYVDIAFQKQDNLPTPCIIDGNLNTISGNYLFAEEQYQKAIKLNSYNFIPFDRLGDVYLKVQDYQTAEKYYHDATTRKAVLESIDEDVKDILPLFKSIVPIKILNPPDTTILSNDVISCFIFGKIHFDKKEDIKAKKWFEKVVSLDPENPMVYQYLGQIANDSEEYALAEYYFNLAIKFHLQDSLLIDHIRNATKGLSHYEDILEYYEASNFDIYKPNLSLARTYEKWNHFHFAIQQYQKCIELKPSEKTAYQRLWNLYQNQMEMESAESVIHKFGQIYPNEVDEVLGEHYEWSLNIYKEDIQKTAYYAYKYGLLLHEYIMKQPKEMFTTEPNEEKEQKIKKYLTKGVELLEKVESITVDISIETDAFTKLGDLYLYSNKHEKALENYESVLNIKEDNHSIRSIAAKCADHVYLFKKSLGHLTTLEKSNSLKYEDAIILAKYYMKNGEKEKAITLYEKIANTHAFLKKEIENDLIKLYLRFGDYQKAIELINKWKEDNKTDINLEYMLARANAGLNKPQEALKHLQNAESMGFNYGYVYINDDNFDPYRSTSDWQTINFKMNQYIETKMAASKKQP